MSATEGTVARAVVNTGVAVTKSAINLTDGNTFDISEVSSEYITLFLEHTNADDVLFTIEAGNGQAAGQGDLAITSTAASLRVVTIDSARFKDADGLITITPTAVNSGETPTGNVYLVNAL